ncbi:MAG: translin family protein [Candidatus Nanoarchaeia archaeon]
MINEKDFLRIRDDFEFFESQREELIKKSRDILRHCKHAIFSIHNGELKKAEKKLQKAEEMIAEAKGLFKSCSKLDSIGMVSSAMQEYVEAKCYMGFVASKKIPTYKSLKVQVDDYLLGLCDLTGELARRAVVSVINNNIQEVYNIKEVIEKIFGLFLQLNLRNGELRKKSDAIKWNLKKVEGVIYDLKTRGLDDGQ